MHQRVGNPGRPPGERVTYCFEVTNTGSAHLNDVSVADDSLGIDASAMSFISGAFPLAPGQKVLLSYQALAQESLVNVAVAGGNPVNAAGLPIFGLASPQDSDSAEVQATGEVLERELAGRASIEVRRHRPPAGGWRARPAVARRA